MVEEYRYGFEIEMFNGPKGTGKPRFDGDDCEPSCPYMVRDEFCEKYGEHICQCRRLEECRADHCKGDSE